MDKLTKKQALVYEFLRTEAKKKGYQPGIRDICEALGMRSTSTVHKHLTALEEKGFIRRNATRASRYIEILDREYAEDEGGVRGGQEIFVHTVPDDELRAEGIIRGDVVICRRGAIAEAGQIVAVWRSGGISLQKQQEGGRAEVLGIVSELRRRY